MPRNTPLSSKAALCSQPSWSRLLLKQTRNPSRAGARIAPPPCSTRGVGRRPTSSGSTHRRNRDPRCRLQHERETGPISAACSALRRAQANVARTRAMSCLHRPNLAQIRHNVRQRRRRPDSARTLAEVGLPSRAISAGAGARCGPGEHCPSNIIHACANPAYVSELGHILSSRAQV